MTDDTPKPRALGRKVIRPTLKPTDLLTEKPEWVGTWTAQIITLMPDAFPGVLGESLTGRALKDSKWALRTINLRDFGVGKHKNVDDTPAGGGAGMVIRPDVLDDAIQHAGQFARGNMPLIYLSPRGKRFDQAMAREWASYDGLTMICGRFEGIDQRVIDAYRIQEVSLGDFVMTGGELAAQAMIDATVRLIPGVLGNAESIEDESHSNGLLEHPQYTRPQTWRGLEIPEVLTSGHHGNIEKWRREKAEDLTKERRPDMWESYKSTDPK
ncbi:tRNA (guanosine(37)-N1)-methyltransferase TrmD [Marivivens niveibacter]|uniref:tRNA (guanine-N(1)-)-methyltransferase n=1 Tax=Marivivens niveibacter TaxID=1930667 RepID=A0A251X1H5_9RHOB|nr:tRNA (guanosine(37)-N1)-methyltransferase TrmD [Marivivens niveibacter]OUD10255.1 tRNA (guanosine(37)-N1)-methyltransferase TrmD [Marivivens niveibacter]